MPANILANIPFINVFKMSPRLGDLVQRHLWVLRMPWLPKVQIGNDYHSMYESRVQCTISNRRLLLNSISVKVINNIPTKLLWV